jgi:glucose-1-phosphate thymidylyltransferase
VKAYLLAAGYATRMYPLTRDRPKPLLEVAGAPILSHILEGVLALEGLSEVVVISNDRFAKHFEAWAAALGAPVPVRVLNDGSTSDDDKLGAIGDLAFALEQAPTRGEDWLVVAGDNLLAFDLRHLQQVFLEHRDPLLSVREVTRLDEPGEQGVQSRYNEVMLNEEGVVVGFREKPPEAVSPLTAIALYFFPGSVADLLPRYLAEGGNPDAPGHFIAWLVDQVPVRATPLLGERFDIGSLEGLEHAREHYIPKSR